MSTRGTRKPTGRPSSYKPEYARIAREMCKLGATDPELAQSFGISRETLNQWRLKYRDFADALKSGKDAMDERVERSLAQRAVGFTYDAVKIFNAGGKPLVVPYREYVPPDTAACIFWLKNRRSAEWRDKPAEQIQDDIAEAIRREAATMGSLFPSRANGEAKH